ncbi:MAG TPA: hypothetical protein VGF47_05225 [Solirubrobacteraceae bacterium]
MTSCGGVGIEHDVRGAARRCVSAALAGLVVVAMLAAALAAPTASADVNQADALIYMPYGLVHFVRPQDEVDEYLAQVDSYGIGQLIFATPKVTKKGVVKLPRHNKEMLARWSSRAAAYDAAHGAQLGITLVVPAKVKGVKGSGIDLESTVVRAQIVTGIEAALGLGIDGVQLDFEPYPTSAGYVALLEELDAMFARAGFDGRFSVAAPANTSRWSPSYLKRVSELLTELNPLYYDSELTTIPVYESWTENSLAYYSANVDSATKIVPVLPSYSSNPWHRPSVENMETATSAVSTALAAGSRVNGAGIWWGYGFLMDEEGAYDGSADRAAWQASTRALSFSP